MDQPRKTIRSHPLGREARVERDMANSKRSNSSNGHD